MTEGFDPTFQAAGTGSRGGTVPDPGGTPLPGYFLAADATFRPINVTPGAPPPAPGPALDTWACQVAGYLTYEVCRLAVKFAVDWLPTSWIGDVVGGIVVGLLQAVLPEGAPLEAPYAGMVFDWITMHVNVYLTDFGAKLLDDVMWAKIHCSIYTAIDALPTDLQTALLSAGTAIAALTGYPSGVLTGIQYLLTHLGITTFLGIPTDAFARTYDCSTCATTHIGPTKPILQTSFDLIVEDTSTVGAFIDTVEFMDSTVAISGSKASVTGNGVEFTDGTHDVPGAKKLTVTGGVIGGAPPNATLLIPASIDGIELIDETHDLTGVQSVTTERMLVGGTSPAATLAPDGAQLPSLVFDQAGAIPVAASGGTSITGLTVGRTYALQSTGGPWYPEGTPPTPYSYSWDASVDAGATWQNVFNLTSTPSGPTASTPTWAISCDITDGLHARVAFVATTTSIAVRVHDSVYTDNTGALGWELLDVVYDAAAIQVQHGGTAVATRPVIDVVDSASVTATVTDDPTNDRVTLSLAAVTGGGGLFNNPMTAKGDLIVGGTAGAPTRFPVGSDNKFIRALAAATDGIEWDNLAASDITSGLLALARGGLNLDTSAVALGDLLVGASGGGAWQLGGIGGGSGISVTLLGGIYTVSATGSGGGGTALTKIGSVSVSGSAAASISLTGISGSYSELWLTIVGAGDTAAANIGIIVQFNGDTATNYNYNYLFGQGGTDSGSEGYATASPIAGFITAASAPTNRAGVSYLKIPQYAGTTWQKTWLFESSDPRGDSSGNQVYLAGNGVWKSTAAISSIKLIPTAGNFAVGTIVTAYGVA